MNDDKNRILCSIRHSLHRTGELPKSIQATLKQRLEQPIANFKPPLKQDKIACFIDKAKAVHSKISRLSSLADVPAVVEADLSKHALPHIVVSAGLGVSWPGHWQVEQRAAQATDQLSVTGAFAGIAETGSVMLLSGPDHPTSVNFLPQSHIVLLYESQIVAHLEEALVRLRSEHPSLPRSINLICGPSKTGDIEQTLLEGVHGPRYFHIIILSD